MAARARGYSTCDVKELFSPQRHRLLRGEPEPPVVSDGPVTELVSGVRSHSGTWRAFPDPAVKALLQEKTQQTLEVLERCGSTLEKIEQIFALFCCFVFFWVVEKKMGF